MKRELAILLLGAVVLSGCTTTTPPPPSDDANGSTSPQPVTPTPAPNPTMPDPEEASIDDIVIKKSELEQPLIAAHGLNILLELVQLRLAEEQTRRQGIEVTPQDVQYEETQTLIGFRNASHQDSSTTEPAAGDSSDTLAPEDRSRLRSQLVTGEHMTQTEFDLAMTVNAHLRKLVAPLVEKQITDVLMHDRFNAIYGEKAHINFIQLPDKKTAIKVRSELTAGESFEQEMKLHAYNARGQQTAAPLPPFSRQDQHYPQAFKDAAFLLKPHDISQPIELNDTYFILQMIELVPPQFAKFEDYKDSIHQDLLQEGVQNGVGQLRHDLGMVALNSLQIKDPVLKKQWDEDLNKKTQDLRDAQTLKDQFQKQRIELTTQPTTEPATEPATAPAR